MLTPYWQMDLIIYETIILFPIYILLLMDIVIARKKLSMFQSSYYILVISQGIADILTILIIINLLLARYFAIGNILTYDLQDYGMASFHSNTGPLLFVLRLFGVFLITLQRYLAVCRNGGTMNRVFNNIPWYILIAIHWGIPMLIYTPAFIVSNAHFDNPNTLFIVNTTQHMQTFSMIVVISFFVIGILILMMYLSVLLVLFQTRKVVGTINTAIFRKRSMRYQEIRLAIHVFLLVTMSVFTFLYYFFEYQFASNQIDGERRSLRVYYPIVAGNFSYINPITLLALNRDVQARIKSWFCGKKGIADFSTVFAIIALLLPRYFGIGNSLLFALGPYGGASFFSNSGPFFFVLRIYGVFLITLQRFLTVCVATSRLTAKFALIRPFKIVLLHWLVALLIFSPALLLSDTVFENSENLFLINNEAQSRAFSIIVISCFAVFGPTTIVLYSQMLKVICSSNHAPLSNTSIRKRASRYQEHRLSIHVFLLTIMSILTFFYYFCEYLYSDRITSEAMRYVRKFYPLISGNFSFISPMVLIILNKEVQSSLKKMFCSKLAATTENSLRLNTWTTSP
ncbi:unnamed protein product [Caenorhabditis angaria]|uniref:G-protein coupled receptors family 1 profile domain-containing protein n=1 Tax=Caenorhabditis angaria TaxID=860376 RepID=A0A9P1IXC1_9PELO|nr:unnamed protein product [Caenorhabditis angaria]